MSKKLFNKKKNYLIFSMVLSLILSIGLAYALDVKVDNYKGSYNIGTTFDVKVYLDGYVTDMTGFEFDLYWNKNILNCVDATPNPTNFWTNPYPAGEGLDTGHYFLGYSGLNEKYTGSGKTIATLKFKVVSKGTSPLDLRNVMLLSSKDHTISIIKADSVDGSFDNTVVSGSATPLSVLRELIRMVFGIFKI